ncbi:MAG: LPS assembly protein LptD [Opitutaceae bacterium]
MTRRIAAILGLSLAVRLLASDPSGTPEPAVNLVAPVITAPGGQLVEDFDGDMEVTGGAVWRQGPLLVTADTLRYDHRYNVVIAAGHVTMTRGHERLLADYLEYHRADGSFFARNIRVTPRYPIVIQGKSAEGRGRQITVYDAVVTYTDPGRWKPSIKAHEIVYAPGHYLKTVRSALGLSGMEFVPLGSISQNLNAAISESILSFDLGYRSSLGAIFGAGVHYPVTADGRVGGNLTWFTKRGLMAGPAFSYTDPDDNVQDVLTSGFIEDHGPRLDDLFGDPIPEGRGYVSWEHQQSIDGGAWTIDGEFNWWEDSDVIRDFYPKQFYPVQTPDSFLEALYSGQDDFAWAFARYQPDDFVDVQERLPEIGYALAPIAIGGGFYERLSASAASLEEIPPEGGPTLSDQRLDTFYELSRPIAFGPGSSATFTPIIGGRLTDYADTRGQADADSDGYLRALGEIGFDATAEASGTFGYTNPTWDIDGLRHLVEPEISYRFVPNANEGADRIPQIDVPTFTTYLAPLDLGDVRALDQLEPVNTLRLGVQNILQTRDSGYGSRNLIDLTVTDDLNFTRTPQEPDFSDVHTELALTPAHWVEFDLAQIFSPRTFNQREFDSTLVLRNGDDWTLQLASDFLKHEDNAYLVSYSQRINEQYEATVLLEYDARLRAFPERAFGIVQNLVNTWRVKYLLTLNGGPNREGRLGMQVEADVVRY